MLTFKEVIPTILKKAPHRRTRGPEPTGEVDPELREVEIRRSERRLAEERVDRELERLLDEEHDSDLSACAPQLCEAEVDGRVTRMGTCWPAHRL